LLKSDGSSRRGRRRAQKESPSAMAASPSAICSSPALRRCQSLRSLRESLAWQHCSVWLATSACRLWSSVRSGSASSTFRLRSSPGRRSSFKPQPSARLVGNLPGSCADPCISSSPSQKSACVSHHLLRRSLALHHCRRDPPHPQADPQVRQGPRLGTCSRRRMGRGTRSLGRRGQLGESARVCHRGLRLSLTVSVALLSGPSLCAPHVSALDDTKYYACQAHVGH
jgi:hypothetical protein